MNPRRRIAIRAALTEALQLEELLIQLLIEGDKGDASEEVALIRAEQILFYLSPKERNDL